ncbi:MAG TPA: hypothetical protein VN889_07185, partial [Solirubrobacteraceae bacterium]|nr:hypothetical protein [Solirubrobacteraceae bacterium]
MRAGFAVEDGVALHFRRARLKRVVSSRPDGAAYRVEHACDGVVETPLDVNYLGADVPTSEGTATAVAPARRTRRRAARRASAGNASERRQAAPETTPAPVPA